MTEHTTERSTIERIRADPSLVITYGYIVLCLVSIVFGASTILFFGFNWLSVGLILSALIGLEVWTGWLQFVILPRLRKR